MHFIKRRRHIILQASIEDCDQTPSYGGVWSGFALFVSVSQKGVYGLKSFYM